MSKKNIGNDRFLSFSLGEEEFGMPLHTVREVIAMPETTPVPQSPKYFLGIMNLRGQVISVVDLRVKLGITPKKTSETAVVICDIGTTLIGMVVDSVNQVLSPAKEDVSEKPEIESSKASQFITGVYREEKKLVLYIDIAKCLDIADHTLVQNQKKAA